MLRKFRTPAIVLAILLALYAFAGFVMLPVAARSYAMDFLRENYGNELAIGKLRFNPFTLRLRIENLALDSAQRERLVSFSLLDANVGWWRSLTDRALVFQSLVLQDPFVHAHLREDGSLNLAAAFAGKGEPEPEPKEEGRPPPIVIDDFVLDRGAVRFTDNSAGRDFDRRFEPLDLHVRDFATRPVTPSDLLSLAINVGGQGVINVAGAFSADPLVFDLNLKGERIPLSMFQPYLPETPAAKIARGELSMDLQLSHATADQQSYLGVRGKAAVADLALQVPERDEPVLSWKTMDVSGIDLDLEPNRLAIEEVVFDGFDSTFRIYSDGDTNIGVVMRGGKPAPPADAAEGEEKSPAGKEATPDDGVAAFPYRIGRIVFRNSRVLYNDQLIKPQVAVSIEDFTGDVTGISSDPGARIEAAFKGRVGAHGAADIGSKLAMLEPANDLDAKVSFGNIELTDFSPYSGKFAGYAIEKGKLFLDLKYTLKNGRIVGQNHAVFDQFFLGEKVDSEDATHLPVKFALSLLRDRHGKIDISLPVEGDMNSPGFHWGHLVGQVILNVLTKIVTAPFSFLGGLFGGGPEMEYAQFDAGSGVISAAEGEKIRPLAKALEERPQLKLDVQGWAEKGADGEVLRQQKFDALLAKQAAAGTTPEEALGRAYDAQFGTGAVEKLRAELAAAAQPAGGQEEGQKTGKADKEAARAEREAQAAAAEAMLQEELRKRLLAAQPVSDEELLALAYQRGQQVMDVLVQSGVAGERIFVRRGEIAGEGTRARLILDAR